MEGAGGGHDVGMEGGMGDGGGEGGVEAWGVEGGGGGGGGDQPYMSLTSSPYYTNTIFTSQHATYIWPKRTNFLLAGRGTETKRPKTVMGTVPCAAPEGRGRL